MVRDGITVSNYKKECENGKLPCWMWPLGILFMVLPTLGCTLVTTVMQCRSDDQSEDKIMQTCLMGPAFAIYAPLGAIITTGFALFVEDSEDEDANKKGMATLKLFEVLLESLPQVTLSSTPLSFSNFVLLRHVSPGTTLLGLGCLGSRQSRTSGPGYPSSPTSPALS